MNVLWVCDFTSNDHIGGAELTTEAIISYAPKNIQVTQVKTEHVLDPNVYEFDFLVVDSLTRLANPKAVSALLDKKPFITVEYDYNKITPHRHLHGHNDYIYTMQNGEWGDWYFDFWTHPNLKLACFMSEKQQAIYLDAINRVLQPILEADRTFVLSSIFSEDTYTTIDKLLAANKRNGVSRSGYVVYQTANRLKGTEASIAYAQSHNLEPVVPFSNLAPKQLLRLFSQSQGLVFMPTMEDTCPRMAIEAKLLGCECHLGDFVQHKDEAWFTGDTDAIREYLMEQPKKFWQFVERFANE